jgi:broad specificity phosphatase PhoE
MIETATAAGRRTALALIFIRHGETDWNRDLRYQGQRDIALNAIGRRQAERNGRAVAALLPLAPWRLIASPLGRAVETMQLAMDAAGRPAVAFETDPLLKEISYGDWEGLTPAEVAERYPEESRRRDADKWGYAPKNGESYAMLAARVERWFATLSGPTLVVAHGGVLRVLLHQLAGLASHDAPHLVVPQDRIVLFAATSVMMC